GDGITHTVRNRPFGRLLRWRRGGQRFATSRRPHRDSEDKFGAGDTPADGRGTTNLCQALKALRCRSRRLGGGGPFFTPAAQAEARFSSRRRRSPSPGRQRLTRPATRVTRKIWPIIISSPESIRPGWPPGTRLPYPVVVRVV